MIRSDFRITNPQLIIASSSDEEKDVSPITSEEELDEQIIYDNLVESYFKTKSASRLPNEKLCIIMLEMQKFTLLHSNLHLRFRAFLWQEFKALVDDFFQVRKESWKEDIEDPILDTIEWILEIFPEFNDYQPLQIVELEKDFTLLLTEYRDAIVRSSPKIREIFKKLEKFGEDHPEFQSRVPKHAYIPHTEVPTNIFLSRRINLTN